MRFERGFLCLFKIRTNRTYSIQRVTMQPADMLIGLGRGLRFAAVERIADDRPLGRCDRKL